MFYKFLKNQIISKFSLNLKNQRYFSTYKYGILEQKINKTIEESVPAVGFLGGYFCFTDLPVVRCQGSSIILLPTGLAITAAHCVCRTLTSYLKQDPALCDNTYIVANCECIVGGRSYPVKVLAIDNSSDLAILQVIASEPLPSVQLESATPERGSFVLGSGCGNGLFGSVALGTIGFVDRPFRAACSTLFRNETGMRRVPRLPRLPEDMPLLQTTIPLHRGDSGGGVFNINSGKVLGVTSFGQHGLGQSFGIPASKVKHFLRCWWFKYSPFWRGQSIPFMTHGQKCIVSRVVEDYKFQPIYDMDTLKRMRAARDAAGTNVNSALSSLISPDGK